MGTFAIRQVYEFDCCGLEEENSGEVFIYLKYQGMTTLPGFPMYMLRVRAFPFQIFTPPEKLAKTIRCFVKDLIPNRFNPDQDEKFPLLVQDRSWLLPQVYVPGFTYSCIVKSADHTGNCILHDQDNGIDHSYTAPSAPPLAAGDSVKLVVQGIFGNNLRLAPDRLAALTGAGFKVGQSHTFTIRKEKLDEKNRRFLQLIDQSRGFWHRFYLDDQEAAPETDNIELQIGDITPQGWLCLQIPGSRLTDMQRIRQAENTDFGREDDRREFKTSIAFPPGSAGKPDFYRQLRGTIVQVIACFMNSGGGSLYIGVNDAGVVSGIEGDLPCLNNDDANRDKFNGQYGCTTDGYELKIRNAISSELGNFANSLVFIHFYKTEDPDDKTSRRVFCQLDVRPSETPVYCHGTQLFVRAGNSCRQLKNGDITSFILNRMCQHLNRLPLPDPTVPVAPPPAPAPAMPALKLAEDTRADELTGIVALTPPPAAPPSTNWGHLSFFTTGERQFGKPVNAPDLLASLQLTQKHRRSKCRLLQCYASGNVNVVKSIENSLPAKKNQRYKNGWNTDDRLMQVFACHISDYLVIRSTGHDGTPRLKAIQVSEIGAHDSLTAKGNALVPENEAKVDAYQIVPERHSSFIYDIIARGRYTGAGQAASLIRVQDCLAFLDRPRQDSDPHA